MHVNISCSGLNDMLSISLRIIAFDGEYIEEVSDVNSYNSDVY